MTALRSILLLALLVAGTASAQDFDVTLSGVPTAGQPLTIEVTILDAEPVDGQLFYRPTGAPSYESLVPSLTGNTFRVEIPAEAMTARGLEVYGEYVEDGVTYTYPPEDENPTENPISIRIFIGSVVSDVILPPRAYRMVSVPADLGDASAVDVFKDDFGSLDPFRWRLVRWDPGTEQYRDAPDALDSFAGGTAFWLITNTGGTFDIDAADSTPAESQEIVLEPGCNQIGNPFAFPVAWADVIGSGVEGVEPPAAFDGAGDYESDQGVLDPWTGYFVCNNSGGVVTLAVPPREASAVRIAAPAPLSYAVRLRARSGEVGGTSALVGFAEGAEDGRDALDRTALPAIADAVSVRISEGSAALARSLKPGDAEGAAWEVEVAASDGVLRGGARRVTVSLDETGEPPPGFGLYVIDWSLGTALPITDGTVEVTVRPDEPVRSLLVIVGTETFARGASEGAPLEPVSFGLDGGYPNPFGVATTLRYRLDTRTEATLEVFDLLGRRVRVLAEGAHPAGTHAARWDGRDAAGRLVASGVYLVRLRADAATATRRVSLVR